MNELPPIFQKLNTEMFGDEWQYYFRRGHVFYFRSPKSQVRMRLHTSPIGMSDLIKTLVFRKVYKIKPEQAVSVYISGWD